MINGDFGWTATSQIYDTYQKILRKNTKSLSYRRITDLLIELKNTGLVSSRAISRGRAGYGTEYRLLFSPNMIGPCVDKEWWDGVISEKKRNDAIACMTSLLPKQRRGRSLDSLFGKYGLNV